MKTYPLSNFQDQHIKVFLNDPENIKGNYPLEIRFSRNADTEKLREAVSAVFAAHPMLSARIVKNDGCEYEWAYPEETAAVFEPYAEMTAGELAELKSAFIKPFDFAGGGRLYRVKICKTPDAVTLLLDIQHAIFDGTSQAIFIREVVAAYNGNPPAAETDEAFLESLRERQIPDSLERKTEEFKELMEISGGVTVFPEQKTLAEPAGSPRFIFSNTIPADKARAFCGAARVSPNSLFAAAFAAAAYKRTGKKALLVGAIFSGRIGLGLENSIGGYIKTVPLIIRHEPDKTPLENCRLAKQNIHDAKYYGNAMQLNRSGGSVKNFRIPMLYIFHGNLLDAGACPVLHGEKVAVNFITDSKEAKNTPLVAFEFIVAESEGSYTINCKHNDALFDETFIKEFLGDSESFILSLIV
ncbi:MAG: condensation domain-containing protein [Clostridiales bacterium]|jgi:hypothetical protein|nr:condensation domain-containing protein [Clostridiales bacterium]